MEVDERKLAGAGHTNDWRSPANVTGEFVNLTRTIIKITI